MSKTNRRFSLFAALLIFGGGGAWLLSHSWKTHGAASAAALAPRFPSSPLSAPATKASQAAATSPALPAPPPIPGAPSAALSIDSLLSDSSLDNKAVMAGLSAIALDAARSLKERAEAMSHLLNLSVEDPAPVLLPLIGNPRLPPPLCDQILDDALNDPLSWQADAYLAALSRRSEKEIQTKAREHLTFLLDKDYGDNLADWAKAVAEAKAPGHPLGK